MKPIISLTTGTTRGIGRAIFSTLVDKGDAYWINRSRPSCIGKGGWTCDLSDTEMVTATCADIMRASVPFNCLVLNAAYRVFSPIEDLTTEHYIRSLQINTISNFILLREMAGILSSTQGTVIICGSQAANHPAEQGAAYCSSKAALDMLAQVFMYEYRHRGVRLSILEMGAVRNRSKPDDGWKISPAEVADAVLCALESRGNAMISRMEIIPREIPRGEEVGPERLHRI